MVSTYLIYVAWLELCLYGRVRGSGSVVAILLASFWSTGPVYVETIDCSCEQFSRWFERVQGT
jgi:hypothetical protein